MYYELLGVFIMSKSWDYFEEQKKQMENERLKNEIMENVRLEMMAFKEQLRRELLIEFNRYQKQNVEIKIDAKDAIREIQKALLK